MLHKPNIHPGTRIQTNEVYYLYVYMFMFTHITHSIAKAIHACKEKQSSSTITWSEDNPNILRGAITMSPHNAIHSSLASEAV